MYIELYRHVRGNAIASPVVKIIRLQCFIIFFCPKGTSYGRGGPINFGGGSVNWKSNVLVPFLRVKNDKMAIAPHAPFSQMHQIKIIQIVILLITVQGSDYKLQKGLI